MTDAEREQYIREVVDKAPPLTLQQLARLAALSDEAPPQFDHR
jgi:hypothetical protein